MIVGVLEIVLGIPALTLKDKRSVVRRVVERTRHAFTVAVAEVDALDDPGTAILGIAVVTNDRRHATSVLTRVEQFIDALELAEVVTSSTVIEVY